MTDIDDSSIQRKVKDLKTFCNHMTYLPSEVIFLCIFKIYVKIYKYAFSLLFLILSRLMLL